jgi:multiple sugar transport system substrate-binding protein
MRLTSARPTSPRSWLMVAAATTTLVLAACGGGGFDDSDDEAADTTPAEEGTDEPAELSGSLTAMIGSSGEAETNAVQAATQRFTDETGVEVEVIPAQDLVQQLQQGFVGGDPPDLFYVSPDRFRIWQEGGSLYPYGDQFEDADDFYESLRQAFTYEDELYCIPKDGGASALVIDTDAWEEAGLTDADIPQDWDDLSSVAETLTTDDRVGLVFAGEYNSIGTFLLGGGGWYVNEDETEVTADTPENVASLHYVLDNIEAGNFAYASDVEAEWEGVALGAGKAAMVISGGWIAGALDTDYPDRNWRAVEMPAGPGGPGAGVFTNCWGIAEQSENKDAAVELVRHLTSPEEQQIFTQTYGVPSYSRVSLEEWIEEELTPNETAFSAGLAYGRAQVAVPGFDSVLGDFNAQLEAMRAGSVTPEQALESLQTNGEAVISQD